MTGQQMLSPARLRQRAAHVVRDPLSRSAWPLILNTGSNGLLGVAYWVLAARLYDRATVGTNTALIAAMTTLSGISQLNMGPSLAVLVPRAGSRARRILLYVYGAVTAFSVVVLSVFLLAVLPHLSQLSEVLHSAGTIVVLAVAVLLFNLFALQDAALVSLRWGKLIPVENTSFGFLKIVLVVTLSGVFPAMGIFASWLIPMLVMVPVVSGLIFLRGRNQGSSAALGNGPREPLRRLGLDYVGYLFQVSSTFFLPVIALELLEPVAASVFAVAWLTSSTMDLLATNVGTALTVETSYGEDPRALRRTIFRRAVPLVALVSGLGLLAAPLILHLYGAQYSAEGASTLQILLLASVPRCLVTFAIAESRAHRRMWVIVWLRAQNAVLALGLSFLLTPRVGANGMAVAWLIAQLAGGACALAQVWRRRPALLPETT
ncbi:lipopolysaccharide biosynthesis protein [Micromonospora sp. IBHARD004]|uniref:lipopolysaccharide biosynthesis protein n=1 Tax=Micromonospora sp. IBHARD004 TaxID=3457764 RepID=UPI00405971EF